MADAATVASSFFSDYTHPRALPDGQFSIYLNEEVPTTSIDYAADIYKLYPVANGWKLREIVLGNHGDADTGSGTLDMDIVLQDDNGTTILYNAGTAFATARTTPLVILLADSSNNPYVQVVDTAGTAYIGFKVNTAANTPAAVRYPMAIRVSNN